jgi:crotonobetainyl-CoA:carnitine CoA-transferase CaiB-like acyl-CoA transferase
MLAVGNDAQFAHFCRCVGHEDWAADPRFATNQQRVAHRAVLVALLTEVMKTRSTAQWIEALEAAGVACGPINDIAAVFADPQVIARGLQLAIPGPQVPGAAGQPVPSIASPVRLSASPVSYHLPPPALGAHTRAVLSEILGLTGAQLDALAKQGAI